MTSNVKARAATDISIREIVEPGEMRAVEELQKNVWGFADLDVVPVTQLVAAVNAGGVVIGAFDGDTLAGFAYGFAGLEHGTLTHHSHMLAVNRDYRNLGVGYRLKLAQRDFALAQGITEMTWTFDPLQGLNAYFNFNRLGVVADRYLVDLYGKDSASFLHRNGTDRLWVTWKLASASVEERLLDTKPVYPLERASRLIEVADNDAPRANGSALQNADALALIEIPADITELTRHDSGLAEEWRLSTRRAFIDAFAAGFVAVDYLMAADHRRIGRYVLVQRLKDLAGNNKKRNTVTPI